MQQEFAEKVKTFLSNLEWRQSGAVLKTEIEKYTSKFTFVLNGKKVLEFKTSIKEKKVIVEAGAYRKFVKGLRKLPEFDDLSKKEVRVALEKELKEVLENMATL
jgi:hypothetical protein